RKRSWRNGAWWWIWCTIGPQSHHQAQINHEKPARARTGERFEGLARQKCRKCRGSALIGLQGCPIDADPSRPRGRGREAAGAREQGTLIEIMPNDLLGPNPEEVQLWLRFPAAPAGAVSHP